MSLSSGFRGASADAVAALAEAVSGSARVADDLFAVVAALRTEGSLRRFLTDSSVPTEAKRGLVTQVFEGRVDASTLGLLEDAVGRRWTRTRDLSDGLEHVGVVAAVRSSGDDAERLADELFTVRQAVTASADLRNALSDPARTPQDKRALVDDLLAGKTAPATVTLVKQALAGSFRTVVAALEHFEKVAAEVRGQGVATVRVARPLAERELERLTAALRAQYGREVHLNVVVDPDVLGGIRVEIGDDVIDGTVSSRLEEARRKIAS